MTLPLEVAAAAAAGGLIGADAGMAVTVTPLLVVAELAAMIPPPPVSVGRGSTLTAFSMISSPILTMLMLLLLEAAFRIWCLAAVVAAGVDAEPVAVEVLPPAAAAASPVIVVALRAFNDVRPIMVVVVVPPPV